MRIEQQRGPDRPHAPYHVTVGPSKTLRIVSGAVLKQHRVGVRLGPNSGLGGGDKMYATLFDADSGELLSFMGFPFGTVAHGGGGRHRGQAYGAGRF